MKKERLDVILVNRGLFESRERARSSIMAGAVFVNGEKADKPGVKFHPDIEVQIREKTNPYVSRGGLKLEKALREFNLDLNGRTAVDVGASTGGFTDCMIKNGVSRVYAIDVGYGQLAWELRNDSRVVCMERRNIRYIKPEDIGNPVNFAVIDVSFISLRKVLPVVKQLLDSRGEVVCLVKPQFEAGREKVGKRGVVRNPDVHREVLLEVVMFALEEGFAVRGLTFSPITGPEGNIEYLLYLSVQGDRQGLADIHEWVAAVVEESHKQLALKT